MILRASITVVEFLKHQYENFYLTKVSNYFLDKEPYSNLILKASINRSKAQTKSRIRRLIAEAPNSKPFSTYIGLLSFENPRKPILILKGPHLRKVPKPMCPEICKDLGLSCRT